MNAYCGGFGSPTPWGRLGRRAGAYIRIVIIVVVLVIGTKLGADPITMIGWGTLTWLLTGLAGGPARGPAGAGGRAW